jgi:hypothetical protein
LAHEPLVVLVFEEKNLELKKFKNTYGHTYKYFEATVEILEENVLYFMLYKKINLRQKY